MQQMLVLTKRWPRGDDHRWLPLMMIPQSRHAWRRQIPGDGLRDILRRLATIEHESVQARSAVGGKFIEPLANLVMEIAGNALAGRVNDLRRADGDHGSFWRQAQHQL